MSSFAARIDAHMDDILSLPDRATLRELHAHTFGRDNPAPTLPISASTTKGIVVTSELDSFAAARVLSSFPELGRPVVLNMANEHNCGGAWCEHAGSQEEDLFRASSLPLSLWPRRRVDDDRLGSYDEALPRDTSLYPWASEATVLYSPSVVVTKVAAHPTKHRPMVAIASVAAQDLRSERPHYKGPFEEALTREKARSLLWACVRYGHRAVVLGALGCGAFRNDPERVAPIFAQLLSGEFHGRFDCVVFAIIKSAHNLGTFSHHFPLVDLVDHLNLVVARAETPGSDLSAPVSS